MLIKHSNKGKRERPNSLSDYERTYNHAIDLVAEAVAHANKVETRRVAAFKLKPTQYRLFREGLRILMAKKKQKLEDGAELYFEGYLILEGSRGQYDTIKTEYVENALNPKKFKPN